MCAKTYAQGGFLELVTNFSCSQKGHKEEHVQIIVLLGGKHPPMNDNWECILHVFFVFVKKKSWKDSKNTFYIWIFYKDGH